MGERERSIRLEKKEEGGSSIGTLASFLGLTHCLEVKRKNKRPPSPAWLLFRWMPTKSGSASTPSVLLEELPSLRTSHTHTVASVLELSSSGAPEGSMWSVFSFLRDGAQQWGSTAVRSHAIRHQAGAISSRGAVTGSWHNIAWCIASGHKAAQQILSPLVYPRSSLP